MIDSMCLCVVSLRVLIPVSSPGVVCGRVLSSSFFWGNLFYILVLFGYILKFNSLINDQFCITER